MKGVLLIDFDGTIVEHSFPDIGETLPGAFEVLKELQQYGYKLILWTCREDVRHKIDKQYLKDAVDFCKHNGIEFDAVNETILDFDFRSCYNCDTRKPHATWHIDDRNLGGFMGWDKVREFLIEGKGAEWRLS